MTIQRRLMTRETERGKTKKKKKKKKKCKEKKTRMTAMATTAMALRFSTVSAELGIVAVRV